MSPKHLIWGHSKSCAKQIILAAKSKTIVASDLEVWWPDYIVSNGGSTGFFKVDILMRMLIDFSVSSAMPSKPTRMLRLRVISRICCNNYWMIQNIVLMNRSSDPYALLTLFGIGHLPADLVPKGFLCINTTRNMLRSMVVVYDSYSC